jgi:hypothetical protein
MRSIRVGGRTHCWVVGSLLREQEREHFRAAREQPFLRARARIPRQNNSTEIEAKVQHTQEVVQHGFRGPYSHLCAQKSRQQTTFNYVRTVWILSVRTTVLWHKFRGGTDSRTQAVPYGFRTGPYSPFLAQKSRQIAVWFFWKVWHGFQGRSYNH